MNGADHFDEALDDYFNETINLSVLPDEEDLEKMKITLNWLIKNRDLVRVFYLKEYSSKEELYAKISAVNFKTAPSNEIYYDIKEFMNHDSGESV